MVHKQKGIVELPNLQVGGSRITTGLAVSPVAGALLIDESRPVRRARIYLESALTAEIDADDDFGSVKLCDLPDTNVVFLGAIADAVVTGTGGLSVLNSIDVAIGTVVTASTDFTNAGEDNLVAKIDATAGGVVKGGGAVPAGVEALADGSSNAIYLNVAAAIATDGAVVFAAGSYFDVLYVDLGAEA